MTKPAVCSIHRARLQDTTSGVKDSALVRGGRVVLPDGVIQADIAVEKGKIIAVEPEIKGKFQEVFDAAGKVIFPATIDAHVHFNSPGRTDWETVREGSAAFVAGGGGTFIDMPLNSDPCTLDKESFLEKMKLFEKESCADFGLWGGFTPDNLDKLEELAACGAVGFKAFTCPSGIDGFRGIDDYTALKGMETIKKLGLPLIVHCENENLIKGFANETKGETADDFFYAHQEITETSAVRNILALAEETGVRLIIAHVSSAKSIDLIQEAKARGVNVAAETTLVYLTLTQEDVRRLGPVAKCSPPVRDRANLEKMWEKVFAGAVDFISSDHSPSDPSLKEGRSFMKAWGGISSVQHTLSGMFTYGCKGRGLPYQALAKLLSTNIAEFLHLPHKGKIAPGYDADLAIVDPEKTYTVTPQILLQKHKVSPYMNQHFASARRLT